MMLGSVVLGSLLGMGSSVVWLVMGGSFLSAFLIYASVGAAAVILIPCVFLLLGAVHRRADCARGTRVGGNLQRE